MIKSIVTGLINFISEREYLVELMLIVARKMFGDDAVDLVMAEVKNAEVRLKDGKEKFDYVKGRLLSELSKFKENAEKKRFWINLIIEVVVAYLTMKKKINVKE